MCDCFLQNMQTKVNKDEKDKFNTYALQFLLPVLKQLDKEQMTEKALEAKIQGVSSNHLSQLFFK